MSQQDTFERQPLRGDRVGFVNATVVSKLTLSTFERNTLLFLVCFLLRCCFIIRIEVEVMQSRNVFTQSYLY